MGVLQDGVDQAFSEAPRRFCRAMIERKFAEKDLIDPDLVERVTVAIMDDQHDGDVIELDMPFDIEITDADIVELNQSIGNLTDGFSKLFEKMGKDLGRSLANESREQWITKSIFVAKERETLRLKIARDWREPFSDLRLLIELCSGYGHDFNDVQLRRPSQRNVTKNGLLSRLHIRACRLAEEIALLLDNGHTEGAEARWRTLFEVSVTALLIKEGGEQLAKRYVDHEAVEHKKTLDDHDRAISVNQDMRPRFNAADRKALNAELTRVTKRYGNSFRGMYGWAAGQLGLGEQPHFHHLQEAAGALSAKLEYRLACFGTHASPVKLAQPMHKWDPTLHVPGNFAAGFENPGANTAYTLVQITTALFDESWDLDKIVELRTLMCVRDDVETKMNGVARSIVKREQRNIDRVLQRTHAKPQRRSQIIGKRS